MGRSGSSAIFSAEPEGEAVVPGVVGLLVEQHGEGLGAREARAIAGRLEHGDEVLAGAACYTESPATNSNSARTPHR